MMYLSYSLGNILTGLKEVRSGGLGERGGVPSLTIICMFRDLTNIIIVSLITLEVAINLVIKIKIEPDLNSTGTSPGIWKLDSFYGLE